MVVGMYESKPEVANARQMDESALVRDYIDLVKSGDKSAAFTLAPHLNSCPDKNLTVQGLLELAKIYPSLDNSEKKKLRDELSFLPNMFGASDLRASATSLSEDAATKRTLSTFFKARPVQYASNDGNLFAMANSAQDELPNFDLKPKKEGEKTDDSKTVKIDVWQDRIKIPNLRPNLRLAQSLSYMMPDFVLSPQVKQIFQGSIGYAQLAQEKYGKTMYEMTKEEHVELAGIIGEKYKDALRYQRAIDAFGSSECFSLFEKDKIQAVCNDILKYSKSNEISDVEKQQLISGDLAGFIRGNGPAGKKFYAALFDVPELENTGKVYYNAWSAGLLIVPGQSFDITSDQPGKAAEWYMNVLIQGKKEITNETFTQDNVADFIPETTFSKETIMSVHVGGGYLIQADTFPFWLEGSVLLNDPASEAPLGIGEAHLGAGSRSNVLGKVGEAGGALKLGGGEYGQFEPYLGITYFNNRGSSESLGVVFEKTDMDSETLTFKSKSGNSGVEFMGSVAYSSPTFIVNMMFVHLRGEFNHNTLFGKSVGAVETILAIKPVSWFNAGLGGRFETSGQTTFGGDLTFELPNGLGLSIAGYYTLGIIAEEGLKCQEGVGKSIPSNLGAMEAKVSVPLSLFFK